jgi:hypothetical protein
VEEHPVRLEEPPIIEQTVHRRKLGRQTQHRLRQDRFPQRGLRVYRPQHDGLDPY